jgi:hypothetical protein
MTALMRTADREARTAPDAAITPPSPKGEAGPSPERLSRSICNVRVTQCQRLA